MPEQVPQPTGSEVPISPSSGAGSSPAPSSAPTSGLAPSTSTAGPAPDGVAGSGSLSPSSSPSTPAEQQYQTVRDTLRNYGLDQNFLSQFSDDHQALQYLVGAHRQREELSQLAQYGRQYMQHADQFQAWMRTQQEAQQAQQAQQQAWWKAPEYDPSWASKLTRDPATGEIRATPGSDPALVQKYLAWVEHQRGFLDRFSQDPIKAIAPGVEEIARQVATQMIQQHLGGYQQQTQASAIIQQNADWLHQRDQQGQVQRDPRTGQPALSEYGRRYAAYVQQAEQLGIRDVQAQHNYAVGFVQRDALAAVYQGQRQAQSAQVQGDAAKQAFLANAAGGTHQPNNTGAVGVNGAPANPPPASGARGLQELLMKNMKAAGFQPGVPLDLGR